MVQDQRSDTRKQGETLALTARPRCRNGGRAEPSNEHGPRPIVTASRTAF